LPNATTILCGDSEYCGRAPASGVMPSVIDCILQEQYSISRYEFAILAVVSGLSIGKYEKIRQLDVLIKS
jgi:hypothetical protein